MSNILRYPLARAGGEEAAGRKRKRNSHGHSPALLAGEGIQQGWETWSQSVCNGGTGPPWALLFQGQKRHQSQIHLHLPAEISSVLIAMLLQAGSINSLGKNTFPVFLSTRGHKHKCFSLLSQITPQPACWTGTSFNFNYLPVQITGN